MPRPSRAITLSANGSITIPPPTSFESLLSLKGRCVTVTGGSYISGTNIVVDGAQSLR